MTSNRSATSSYALALITMFTLTQSCKGGGGSGTASGPATSPAPVESTEPDVVSAGSLAVTATLPAGSTADTSIALKVSSGSNPSFKQAATAPITSGALVVNVSSDSTTSLTADASASAKGAVLITLTASSDKFEAGASMKFIEIPTGADQSLVKLPTELLADKSKTDLGTLSDTDGSFVAGSVNATTLVRADAASKLTELASTDNGLKLIRNAYMNGESGDAKNLRVNPQYMFRGDLRPFIAATDYLSTNLSGRALNALYHAYLLRFEGVHPDITVAGLCRASAESGTEAADELRLVPPQKNLGGVAQSPVIAFNKDECTGNCPTLTEFTSKGSYKQNADRCYSDFDSNTGNYFVLDNQTTGDGTKRLNFNWGSGHGFKGAIPEGLWDMKLKKGAAGWQLIGRFDIGSAFPLSDDSANAFPVIYMPAIKMTRDSNQKLTGFSMKWMLWNPTISAYAEVTDLSLAKDIVKDMAFYIGDLSNTGWANKDKDTDSIYFEHPTSGSVYNMDLTKLPRPWKVVASNFNIENDEATPTAHSIAISYSIYGVYYRFDYRPENL